MKMSCAVSINSLEAGLEGTLIKFAYDTKFRGDVNSLEGKLKLLSHNILLNL